MTEDRSWTPIELSPEHAPPAGAFSPAVEAAGLVFVSGQVPRDPVSGQWVKERPLEEQARRVFSNLALTLGAAGLELRDVASVSVFLADISHWGRRPPSRSRK
jgi:2-iminobutanoate/2-iminopropanoate deaminase